MVLPSEFQKWTAVEEFAPELQDLKKHFEIVNKDVENKPAKRQKLNHNEAEPLNLDLEAVPLNQLSHNITHKRWNWDASVKALLRMCL